MAPNPVTGVFVRKENRGLDREDSHWEEGPVTTGAELGMMQLQAKGCTNCQESPEAERPGTASP
jgi:hypothetical protein